ncbi:hypothetical protein HPB47_014333 [Ixodes persulcatus]|uniref:Uncharacterized protein n=1 Tax=Ixodes persulcatus TaxID=34615 RepID=A0AC60QWA6_IXOPE|nr:hypothetical protein HPB47_014333 [Ixodes persulcatus]
MPASVARHLGKTREVANDAYLGVTAHWIDDDWVLRSATLQVRHVPERHTAEQCAREVLEAAMAWEIDQKGEASLKCAAHTLQLCIHKALSVTGVERLLAACRRTEPLRRAMKDDSASKSTVPRFTDVNWDMLDELREALGPLLEVTELLGGDRYVTRSVLIPAKKLKNKMRINDCDPAIICRFKAMLVNSIDERLSAWPYYNDYEMATCLDPRFKSLACIDKDHREHVKKKKKEKRKYVFSEESEEASVSCQASLYRSLPEVTDDALDPLQWWRARGCLLSELVPIVKRVMCVSASSTPCERFFSAAGMIHAGLCGAAQRIIKYDVSSPKGSICSVCQA